MAHGSRPLHNARIQRRYRSGVKPLPSGVGRISTQRGIAVKRVKELESQQMEKYDLSDPFAAIRAEISRARIMHPGNRHLFLALIEEVGEIAEAVQRGDIAHARQEAVQVACLAVRLIEEKDASWFSAENDEKPPESALKT